MRRALRSDLLALPLEAAPRLLGAELRTSVGGDDVHLRITEVEAYHGQGTGETPDPGSHARMGRTARNATMWGEPGHLYVYLSHGIHSCVNVVCGPEGTAGGVLLRAGEVVHGVEVAARRRGVSPPLGGVALRDLARGPGRFGQASGLRHPLHDGVDAVGGSPWHGASAELWLTDHPVTDIASGPRVGVAGLAGTEAFPWRFWISGDPTVSAFRWGRGARDASAASPVLD
ncbi:DNA-3-methyladenine glycosylase [Streptomyces sp. AC495_CC817]|uniref:DNA-3-methyladenine glycosylase n=1 Tax=Streptomyces sp. AC495_CC817 TaxID=2823900 RepID=UPI001C258FD8|nr:DNA-3-methyladenine glycosylase [Streptomyces sp. AC495_CC817]